jgi:hypothetical protein
VTVEYPDLTAARTAIAALAVDTLQFDRDTEGASDDTFDYATGGETPPAGDTATVYSGPGKISQAGTQGAGTSIGEQTSEQTDYVASVPISEALAQDFEPKIGDTVTCLASVRDPQMVGKVWVVTDPIYGTFTVSRKAVCRLNLTADGPQ